MSHGKVKDVSKYCKPEKEYARKDYLKKLSVASLRSHAELSFGIEGANTPIKALSNVLSQLVDQLNQLEPNVKIMLYKVKVQVLDGEKAIEIFSSMKIVPTFLSILRD